MISLPTPSGCVGMSAFTGCHAKTREAKLDLTPSLGGTVAVAN